MQFGKITGQEMWVFEREKTMFSSEFPNITYIQSVLLIEGSSLLLLIFQDDHWKICVRFYSNHQPTFHLFIMFLSQSQ
jgi:hypothetical protein